VARIRALECVAEQKALQEGAGAKIDFTLVNASSNTLGIGKVPPILSAIEPSSPSARPRHSNCRTIPEKHIECITLTPNGDARIASGTWNFVGRGGIGGAGGGRWTKRLPARFEWVAAA
jgi:hypothetical protein